jgi:predicted nucleotidyltransferase
MQVSSVEAIFSILNSRGVEYLVVGGLAVNAHGYGRATFDIDLVVDLDPDNVNLLFQALADLAFKPLVPVSAADFGNQTIRDQWRSDKGMVVLQFYSEQHRATRVDVFAQVPFDFDKECRQAVIEEVKDGVPVRFVALQTLIRMKEESGRPKDLDDLEALRWLAAEADIEP